MIKKPLFSIITVTFNAAGVIEDTLDSIRLQRMHDYEYIVVDGASRDDTLEHVKQSGIAPLRIISERDRGIYDAMNKGLKLAQGEYLIFLNAGDSFAGDDALTRLANKAGEDDFDILYGQTQIVDKEHRVLGSRHLTAPGELSADSFKQGMLVCHQAFVVKRTVAPLFDLQYRFSADYDWCIRCLKSSRRNGYVGDRPIVNFLIAPTGTTESNHRASLKERYHIMCKYYGTLPTIIRHLSFIPRYLAEKRRKRRLGKRGECNSCNT